MVLSERCRKPDAASDVDGADVLMVTVLVLLILPPTSRSTPWSR